MAKRKAQKVTVSNTIEPTPRIYIDLHDEDVEMLGEVDVGSVVTLVVRGTVVAKSEAKHQREGGKTERSGTVTLEKYEVEVGTENAFEALAED